MLYARFPGLNSFPENLRKQAPNTYSKLNRLHGTSLQGPKYTLQAPSDPPPGSKIPLPGSKKAPSPCVKQYIKSDPTPPKFLARNLTALSPILSLDYRCLCFRILRSDAFVLSIPCIPCIPVSHRYPIPVSHCIPCIPVSHRFPRVHSPRT